MSRAKFKYGDKVQVSNPKLKTNGRCGTICGTSGRWSHYVCLADGVRLCYRDVNLTLLTENIEEENDAMYITGDFKVAKVKFLSGTNTNTEYEYAMFDDCGKIGNVVVVASANHGLGLAKITDIISKEEAVTQKFEREIITPVYMDAYEERKKNRARLQELNNQMDKRAQELNKLAIFEMLAEKDESLKVMLEEYKGLIGCQ